MVKVPQYRAIAECLICRTSSVGETTKEALENLNCKTRDGIDPLHKAAIKCDGRNVFELKEFNKAHQPRSIVEVEMTEAEAKKAKPAKANVIAPPAKKEPPKEPPKDPEPKNDTEKDEAESK